ncbi:MAG: transporter ATP-binding protein [Microvirga sp.]|nr:transporter ATP-binding protein [Microvirga sp.]
MNVAVKPSAAGLVPPVLEVRDLKTQFFTDEGVVRAVDGVSFSVGAGEALGIVGESGSGKSVTALSLMRLLEEPSRIAGGEIRFQGRDVLGADPEEMRNLRGGRMAMVFQDPMTSLNPVLRIARQLVETMVVHGNYTGDQAADRAVKMLGRMGINAPERAIHSYPHQFSGGMRQRVVLAMGMSNDPVLLIADEPTTALDVTIQAQILELLRELNRDFGTAGRSERLLEVRGLVKHFPLPKSGFFQKRLIVHAVDGVDLDVARGETVGLVGESGCGKSTLARVLIRIHKPDAGSIVFEGQDIAAASAAEIRPLRRRMQMVFQDPYASLNPRMTVADTIGEPLRFHGLAATAAETREQVAELLSTVGLNPKAAQRYPHEFSGGQRQRISIARALAVKPDFIIADEPISALDVNIQAQIINLMLELQEQFGLTYLFIAHDLAVVRHISDRVVVLYLGKVVEVARSGVLFERPLHPYTRYLISAVPVPDAAVERQRVHLQLQGEPPSAVDPPSGCRFRTRCPIAQPVCADVPPPLAEHEDGHFAACHFAGEFRPTNGRVHAARHG